MTKQIEIIVGFIILIGVIVGFGFGLMWMQPSKSEIGAQKKNIGGIKSISENILSDELFNRINQLTKNGDVPVKVYPSEVGKNNPFAPF